MIGAGLTIDNAAGTITGGLAGDGVTRAPAIVFTGGENFVGPGGTITGGITVAGGSFAPALPGSAVGTPLAVGGPLTFAPGTTYAVRITPAASDSTTASGAATLTGATVNVLAGSGTYGARQYTILTAATLNGTTFAGVTSNLAFLTPQLAYQGGTVLLVIGAGTAENPAIPIANPVPGGPAATPDYRLAGVTRNERATATGLTFSAAANGAFAAGPLLTALNNTTLAGAQQALNALSGEIHAGVASTVLVNSGLLRDAIMGRLRSGGPGFGFGPAGTSGTVAAGTYGASYAADAPGRRATLSPVAVGPVLDPQAVAVWGEGFGTFGTARRDGNAATLDRHAGGFVAGIDATPDGGSSRFGIAGGWSRTAIDITGRASSAEVSSGFGALYGAAAAGVFVLRAGAGGAWHDVDTRRAVSFPGFADTARAAYGAYTGQLFGEVALPIAVGPGGFTPAGAIGQALLGGRPEVSLEPFVGGALVHVGRERFRERGGPAALLGSSRDYELGVATAGFRTETQLGAAGEFLLRSSVGWRGAFGDVNPTARLAFADAAATGAATPFNVVSVPLDRHALVTETRLDWRLTASTVVGLRYAGSYGTHAQDSQVTGRIEYRW